YDVQFLIVGQDLDVDTVRQKITDMGECPLVVGDPATIKVHVHVLDPGVPISYGAGLGSLRDVVVEDMQAQYQDFIAERELAPSPLASQEIGVVAVVMGDGLARVFRSLGVGAIVHGGQTMNPSTQDLLEAAESLPVERVILLPNNGNVILAAEQACALSDKPLAVIPSRSIPQGLAALLVINYQADFETNVEVMTSVIGDVETGEVTTATRSATINGVEVTDGQIIGLHDGDLKVAGTNVEQVVQELLGKMDTAQREIITLYYGEDVSEEEAIALADLLQQTWPDQEIEVVFGGQPHYHYILSVE
ncbi:MAG: DAK2 domain-containing protein, partial [Chloroflexi bacterium]|nr:DAK2 domain-containing protein [Chloroflexota bacterium]